MNKTKKTVIIIACIITFNILMYLYPQNIKEQEIQTQITKPEIKEWMIYTTNLLIEIREAQKEDRKFDKAILYMINEYIQNCTNCDIQLPLRIKQKINLIKQEFEWRENIKTIQ